MVKVLPAIGLLVVISILFFTPIFKIKNVQINQNINCLNQKTASETLIGKNIFLVNSHALSKNIQDTSNCADIVNIEKRYPSTVIIQLQTSDAVVIIDSKNLGIAPSGEVLKATNPKNKPIIFLPQSVNVSENSKIKDPNVLFALKIAENLQKADFIPTNIRFPADNSVAIYSNQNFLVIFSPQKDVNSQIDSLQAILAKAKINASKISKIDLEFDKPVIVYEQAK